MQQRAESLTCLGVSAPVADVLGRRNGHALVLVEAELELRLGFVTVLNQGHL